MKPGANLNGSWKLRGYRDEYYTGYNGTLKSVIRYIIIIDGVVIAWSLRSNKKVTLSVT